MTMLKLQEHLAQIPAGGVVLEGSLTIPAEALGMVVFAHGSGSSRHSPRNRAVAAYLQQRHLGTLLMDLLTLGEEQEDMMSGEWRFNIPFLADRVVVAMDWMGKQAPLRDLPIGLFGASTGAAAALVAAAQRPEAVRAVVSRGGRPDMAEEALGLVRAATLLIVGGRDTQVIGMNRRALERLTCEKELEIILGATHLFAEPGALDEVARLAGDWFERRLAAAHV
jgi:pimeloyl-ACP methyl ester carboxylesterase